MQVLPMTIVSVTSVMLYFPACIQSHEHYTNIYNMVNEVPVNTLFLVLTVSYKVHNNINSLLFVFGCCWGTHFKQESAAHLIVPYKHIEILLI